jgi:hypothetical protein
VKYEDSVQGESTNEKAKRENRNSKRILAKEKSRVDYVAPASIEDRARELCVQLNEIPNEETSPDRKKRQRRDSKKVRDFVKKKETDKPCVFGDVLYDVGWIRYMYDGRDDTSTTVGNYP